jgi:hypothetical protein
MGLTADCSDEVSKYASKYVVCDAGYEPSAVFDGQASPDGRGACLFQCVEFAAPPTKHSKGNSGLSSAEIAGIVIGVVGTALIIIGGGYTVYRRRGGRKEVALAGTESPLVSIDAGESLQAGNSEASANAAAATSGGRAALDEYQTAPNDEV